MRTRFQLGPVDTRAAVAVLALPTIVLAQVGSLAQLTALAVLIVGICALDRRTGSRWSGSRSEVEGPLEL